MPLLDELTEWTDLDAAALALGRALGVFSPHTTVADARAVLWTNGKAGNTLYGMLQRLVWLGVLVEDDKGQRYRAGSPTLHPLTPGPDVPSLEAGPPAAAHLDIGSDDATGAFVLQANRAGFRHLARVFDEIADSGLESGWFTRSGDLGLRLLDTRDEPA